MASKYWLKLYHEILSDPKMGRLPDHLWRRCVELFLLAGEMDEDGKLPPVADIAWRLRCTENDIDETLIALSIEDIGIVELRDYEWFIVNFAKRQGPMSSTERSRRHYESSQRAEYYPDEPPTEDQRTSDDNQTNLRTNRPTDTDTDIDTDIESEKEGIPAHAGANSRDVFEALACVCCYDLDTMTDKQRGQLNQSEKRLRKAGADVPLITTFGIWWRQNDWRGQKGDHPKPSQVRETWGEFMAWWDKWWYTICPDYGKEAIDAIQSP